jgi:hypothetical protein
MCSFEATNRFLMLTISMRKRSALSCCHCRHRVAVLHPLQAIFIVAILVHEAHDLAVFIVIKPTLTGPQIPLMLHKSLIEVTDGSCTLIAAGGDPSLG